MTKYFLIDKSLLTKEADKKMANQTATTKYSYARTIVTRQRGVLLQDGSVVGDVHRTPQAAKRLISALIEQGTLAEAYRADLFTQIDEVFGAIAKERTVFFRPCSCELHGGNFVSARDLQMPACDSALFSRFDDAANRAQELLEAGEINDREFGWLLDEINEVVTRDLVTIATLG